MDNPDQKLLPGMTANLTFIIAEKDDVIKIPNAAFRFVPQTNFNRRGNANSANRRNQNAQEKSESSDAETAAISPPTAPVLSGQTRLVWTLDANKNPMRHKIKIGIGDGTTTEMTDGDLTENDAVIVGETSTATAKTSSSSAPGFGGGQTGGRPPGR